MVEIVYLVEKWGEPWNEGYKNLARYICQLLKNIPGVSISVLTKEEVKLSRLVDCDLVWVFNYPETPPTMLHLVELKLNIKKPIVKFLAKKELDTSFKEKIKTMLYRSRLWDAIVTTTELLKLEVARYFRSKKVFVLPPPIPTNYFHPIKRKLAKRALGLEDNLVYIGYCGKISRYVRLDSLVESLRYKLSIRDVVLLLAISNFGTRDDLDRLQLALKEIVIPVKFVCVKDIRVLYSAVDLLIYPVEREGSIEPPLTLLEAMSCGTPVAALKTPATKAIIKNGYNGFLFKRPSELRAIIEELFNYPYILRIISEQARKTILNTFSFPRLIKSYSSFVSEALG